MHFEHDGPAVIAGERILNYADLRAAQPKGDSLLKVPVRIVGGNTPEFVLALFAAWNAGATAVPLNGRLREYELSAIDAKLKGTVPLTLPLGSAILFTSGSTGVPKGVYLTAGGARHWARCCAEVLELTPDDRVGLILPMSHAFGLATLLSTLWAGAAVVLIENERALRGALPELTVLNGSPAAFAGLPDLEIRGLVGGAASPPGLLERHARLLNIYGMTEIGAAAAVRPDDPPDKRVATAGRPLPGYEIRTVDGELQVKGTGVTPGYHGGPATGEWFATGDLGEIDADGYVRISGRAKELIHVGGFNVFPAEVESFLLTHPDVTQAAVLGAPHPRMGQVVKAFVVARDGTTPTDLLRFARANIAGYKVPYGIEIRDALPTLPNGKIDKEALQ